MRKIVARQHRRSAAHRIPVVVVLNNIRSLFNVGSMFRTADGAGIEKIWLCGITGAPPQGQLSKTALGAEQHVPWEHARDTVAILEDHKRRGYQIVLLEQTDASIPYEEFIPRFPICVVVGNEIEGVADGVLPLCDEAVEIDMAGIKNSLNVSVAFGILAYHLRTCAKKHKIVC